MKKYYFIQYVKGGKTYFKNQDGRRSSRAQAEKSKKKIYIESQRKEGDTIQKGELIDRRQTKAEKVKKSQEPKQTGTELSIKNIYVSKEIQNAIEKNYTIYTKSGGVVYNHKSKQSKANALLFNNAMQERFYKKMKKKLDSPFSTLKPLAVKETRPCTLISIA
jgi:hypothetical protein